MFEYTRKTMDNHQLIETQPIIDTFQIIAGKWKFPILYSLCESKKRFKDLQTDIGDITPKMLSHELKILEVNGLITRVAYATVPVTVEYDITAYGRTLEPLLLHVQEWGKKHRLRLKNMSQQPVER